MATHRQIVLHSCTTVAQLHESWAAYICRSQIVFEIHEGVCTLLQVPKVLLFTDKEETPPLFAALSVNFRHRQLLFADVHSGEQAVMEQFGVAKVNMISLLADMFH